jgi:predicted transcriptional regulator
MAPTYRADRRHRSRLEVLRDFLSAVDEGRKKTRIIGRANLNPSSFQSYLDSCLLLRLVEVTPDGYRLTARAARTQEAIERLIVRSSEVDAALLDLHRGFNGSKPSAPATHGTLRYVSTLAWSELLRSASESLSLGSASSGGGLDLELPPGADSVLGDSYRKLASDGSEESRRALIDGEPAPRLRAPRVRSRE